MPKPLPPRNMGCFAPAPPHFSTQNQGHVSLALLVPALSKFIATVIELSLSLK